MGAGPRVGRWRGNSQFHLIKHSCRCFNFSGRKHISGMGQSGINCRPPGAFERAAEECRQGGYTPGSLPVPFQGSLTRSPTRSSTQGAEPWTDNRRRGLGPQAGRVQMPTGLQAFIPGWPAERRNYGPILFASRGKAMVF